MPPTADIVKPLPRALARVVMSGLILKVCCAPPSDIRNPVTTSSKMSGTSYCLVIFLTSERKLFSGRMRPMFARTGSMIRPATSLFFERIRSRVCESLYGTTSVFFEASFNPPSETEIPMWAEPEPALTKTELYAPW